MKIRTKLVVATTAIATLLAIVAPGTGGATPTGADGTMTARWWQWSIEQPLTDHPFADPTTADCSTHQSGDVWYLGGVFNASGDIERTCDVPEGVSLLVPAINVECSTAEPEPFHGFTAGELRTCAHSIPMADAFMTLDGDAVELSWLESAVFPIRGPADNVLFTGEAIKGRSVAYGAWALIPPLEPGAHTLRFGGSFPTFGPYTLDITYHLTVG